MICKYCPNKVPERKRAGKHEKVFCSSRCRTNAKNKRRYPKIRAAAILWLQRRREVEPEVLALERREQALHDKYKKTLADYDNIWIEQIGLCAICHSKLPFDTKTHIDHDHKTGKVRGILCARCNRGIGMLQDRADICQSAANYLISCGS